MARKQKTTEAAPDKPPMSDDDLQVLFFQHKKSYEAALAAKKKADAELLNVAKLAKAELGKDAIARIKLAITLESDEGDDALKTRIESELRVARWMGASAGSQFEMFDDRTPAVDRAFADGKRAGMKGEPRRSDYAPDTEQYRQYMDGFNEGQAALAAQGFKPMSATSALHEVVEAGDDHIRETSAKLGTQEPTHQLNS